MSSNFKHSLEKAVNNEKNLTLEDLIILLDASYEEKDMLLEAADRKRQQYAGDEVHLRAIIEFSNYCRNNCYYCGLRKDNSKIQRYRMDPGKVLESAENAVQLGFKTIVLQSGEDINYPVEEIAWIVRQLKGRYDAAVTLSIGEREENVYSLLREAGADRYLLKQETADSGLFTELRRGTSLKHRIECLKKLKNLDYQVGSGNMVGLPGQTRETLARDLLLMRKLDVDMAGIGPFIPHEQTPLGNYPAGDISLTLKVLALTRLIVPQAHLPATTALTRMHPRGREFALLSGANVIMPNVTPHDYQKFYNIYPGKAQTITIENNIKEIKKLIQSLGRTISTHRGDSLKAFS